MQLFSRATGKRTSNPLSTRSCSCRAFSTVCHRAAGIAPSPIRCQFLPCFRLPAILASGSSPWTPLSSSLLPVTCFGGATFLSLEIRAERWAVLSTVQGGPPRERRFHKPCRSLRGVTRWPISFGSMLFFFPAVQRGYSRQSGSSPSRMTGFTDSVELATSANSRKTRRW